MLRQFRRDARDFPCWWGLSGWVGVIDTAAANMFPEAPQTAPCRTPVAAATQLGIRE